MADGTDFSRRELLVGAGALIFTAPARASARIEEDNIRLRGFRVVQAWPADWRPGGSALLFLPVAAGPCAPIHLRLARRLAAAGHRVLTPELPERVEAERAHDIAGTLALAVRLGADPARLGVVGYDGGAAATRLALSADPRIRAAVIYPGPLMANPVSRPRFGEDTALDPRLLRNPGCANVQAVEAALATGLRWLAVHGVAA